MFAGNRLETLDQFAKAHRHAVDANGGAALELDLDVSGTARRLRERFGGLEQRLVNFARAVVISAADGAAPQVVVDTGVGCDVGGEPHLFRARDFGQRLVQR
jgi:hypothetical protein